MLNDQVRELLSAFLDGQLGRRQRKAVLRLLQQSSEARSYLQQLQEGTLRLSQLPSKKLPADFSKKILRTIAERGLKPAPATLPLHRRVPTWARLAVAAAVLLAASLGGFALYQQFGSSKDVGPIAKDEGLPPAPIAEVKKFTGNRVAIAKFKEPEAKELLTAELKENGSFRVEIAARNVVQAVQKVETVFKNSRIKLVRDGTVAKTKEKTPKTGYLVFIDNLMPEEVAGILQQLGEDDKNPTLQTALLNPLSSSQRLELAKVLNLPVEKLQAAPKAEIELPMFVESDPDKNDKKRPTPKQTPLPERLAVVLAYTPGSVGGGAPSKEVAQALANRPQARPGTVQLIVLLQEGSA